MHGDQSALMKVLKLTDFARALEVDETRGFTKAVVDAGSKQTPPQVLTQVGAAVFTCRFQVLLRYLLLECGFGQVPEQEETDHDRCGQSQIWRNGDG